MITVFPTLNFLLCIEIGGFQQPYSSVLFAGAKLILAHSGRIKTWVN